MDLGMDALGNDGLLPTEDTIHGRTAQHMLGFFLLSCSKFLLFITASLQLAKCDVTL